jgi:hypothetical protein
MTKRTKTKPKPTHTTIPEATRRKRGQVQVKVRMLDTQLDDLRRDHGQPGDSSAKIVLRACGLFSKKDA